MTDSLLSWRNLRVGWESFLELPASWCNCSLGPGDRLLLLGPNGCGKSTLLFALAGSALKCEGEISIQGRRIGLSLSPYRRLRLGIALVPQSSLGFEGLSVALNADLIAAVGGAKRNGPFGGWVDQHRTRPLAGMSGGERQMVALERAFRSGASVLLLDEPWNALDRAASAALDAALDSFPGAVLAVRHLRASIPGRPDGWRLLPIEPKNGS